MYVNIIGKPTKLSKKEAIDAVNFFGSLILSKRLASSIFVDIKFCHDELKKISGDCYFQDDNKRPRIFLIRINNSSGKRKQLITLAHEMVHLKQYAKGELFDYMSAKLMNFSRWGNDIYYVDQWSDDYWFQPWEIEAYGREYGMYNLYRKHIKIGRKKK